MRIIPLVFTAALFAACTPPTYDCLAIPTCEEGEVEVEECASGDDECREVTVCSSTIFCAPDDLTGDGGVSDGG